MVTEDDDPGQDGQRDAAHRADGYHHAHRAPAETAEEEQHARPGPHSGQRSPPDVGQGHDGRRNDRREDERE